MADLFDYMAWRGDLPLSRVPLNNVDALLFSALTYIDFTDIVPPLPDSAVSLRHTAEAFLALPEDQQEIRARVKQDIPLLRAMGESERFGDVALTFYRSILLTQAQTQFAAVSFLLPDGSAFLAFRGTDTSLVGWKEDFNMSFQDTVPAQLEALKYTQAFADAMPIPLRLGGHSKGGNLAVFAAAKCGLSIQQRILAVYNNDGPGFTGYLMGDEGYLAVVPKIRTFIPESSIIGMLLEHEEPYRVIKSRQISILQHELFSWEVLGGDFLYSDQISSEIQFMGDTVKIWLRDMTREERSNFVDAAYRLLSGGGASTVDQLIEPKNVLGFFKTIHTDDQLRRTLSGELAEFVRAARQTLNRRLSEK